MRLSRLALILVLATWSPVRGQIIYIVPPTHAPGTTGTVYGHVVCGDTHLPARMASVTLEPVAVPSVPTSPTNSSGGRGGQPAPSTVVQTLMDGSFTIPNVTPGNYYLIAELDGYVSALSLFSRDDLSHPTEDMVQTMASLVKPVTVTANTSSHAEVTILRGGSISGTVRFEDGMPDVESRVVLQRQFLPHGMKNFDSTTLNSTEVHTDDQGHFRFAGLPEGDYTVFAILFVQNRTDFSTSLASGMDVSNTNTLSVYYGDTFRISSKRITLKGAEDSVANIEIQLSKLHSVSGTVVDATNGAPVNAGTVTIVWPKGGDFANDAQVTKADIEEDGSFHFAFIPEGQFTLSATNLREITRDPRTVLGPGTDDPGGYAVAMTSAQYKAFLQGQQPYGDAQIPLIVESDLTGVTVKVSPKAAAKTTASSQ